jgi:hypothetical protein
MTDQQGCSLLVESQEGEKWRVCWSDDYLDQLKDISPLTIY